jgi:hypothetical protein
MKIIDLITGFESEGYKVLSTGDLAINDYLTNDSVKHLSGRPTGEILVQQGFNPFIWLDDDRVLGLTSDNVACLIDLSEKLLSENFVTKLGNLVLDLNPDEFISIMTSSVSVEFKSGRSVINCPRFTFVTSQNKIVMDVLMTV